MTISSKPIIGHIPRFLEYCKETGLSVNTQKNYKIFLNSFILWMKKENKEHLLPHELVYNDISAYRLYLSQFRTKNGFPLKTTTQGYYLIALRALLGYFRAKDIDSLLPDKIGLPKANMGGKSVKLLDFEQINRLLSVISTNTPIGLRDKAIIETLIHSGLKVRQLTDLNRDQLSENNNLPRELLLKYLKVREDDNNALFINFRSRRGAGKRLTVRYIERIVSSYRRKIGLPFWVTPETLRWAKPMAFLNEEIIIKKIKNHKNLIADHYLDKNIKLLDKDDGEKIEDHSPAWHIIEKNIKDEIIWLKENISVLPGEYKSNPSILSCDDCILRKIAILIVSGKIEAAEFRAKENNNLWKNIDDNSSLEKISRHGRNWHKEMMDLVYKYFKSKNYEGTLEPKLNYGRADLEFCSPNNKKIYIEVGTISLFKLWYNLMSMGNSTFLIISSENNLIELKTN